MAKGDDWDLKGDNAGHVPVEFWRSLTDEEFSEIIDNEYLPLHLEARVRRMLDDQRPPTGDLQIRIHKDDVERLRKMEGSGDGD